MFLCGFLWPQFANLIVTLRIIPNARRNFFLNSASKERGVALFSGL
jgi:hypothetical protein